MPGSDLNSVPLRVEGLGQSQASELGEADGQHCGSLQGEGAGAAVRTAMSARPNRAGLRPYSSSTDNSAASLLLGNLEHATSHLPKKGLNTRGQSQPRMTDKGGQTWPAPESHHKKGQVKPPCQAAQPLFSLTSPRAPWRHCG